MVDDRSFHLSLKKIAKAAKQDTMTFKSLEEPLLDGNIYLDSDYFDTKSIMLYVTIAGTVVSVIMCIVLIIQLRQMAAALIVLQRVVSVK